MKVLHVVPYLSSYYGGPPLVVAQMADCLSDLGVEIDVVTTTADGRFELDVPTGQPVMQDGIRHYYFPRQKPRFWMFSWPLSRWLHKNIANYDLIHVHNLFSYTTLPACFVARYFNVPYVITCHGMLDPWCLTHKWWKKWPYYHFLEKRNLQFSSALHCTSSFEADGLSQLGLRSRATVIPLYVRATDCIERDYSNRGVLSLLFLARLVPIKGLPVLLSSLALLRDRSHIKVHLIIAGQGSKSYIGVLENMIKDLNISESVTFAGFLHGELKAQALAAADVFVLPSYHENFSLATAEAMAAGLPVVISDQVGIASEISAASAGIVVAVDSPVELADAIETYFNAEHRKLAGNNARKLVEISFSKGQFGHSLLEMYNKAINDSI